MTVEELIDILSDLDPRSIVIITDGDGNHFSPLDDVAIGQYIQENGFNGDFVEDDLIDDDMNLNGAQPAICLWPED